MTLTQILKTLVTCILVITFILVTASAYRHHRSISSLAKLSDATSTIMTHLAVDELAYVDESDSKHSYIIDLSKLENLVFAAEFGGDNFEFQVTVNYKLGDNEQELGPYGSVLPNDNTTNCSLTAACALWSNDRFLPAKLSVIVWYA
jgi:septation ring formation regulator EzrA